MLDSEKRLPNRIKTIPMAKLMVGPIIAILKFPNADEHSLSSLAIPPRKNKVISRTFAPSRTAIKECPNSCKTTDKKKSNDVIDPIINPVKNETSPFETVASFACADKVK